MLCLARSIPDRSEQLCTRSLIGFYWKPLYPPAERIINVHFLGAVLIRDSLGAVFVHILGAHSSLLFTAVRALFIYNPWTYTPHPQPMSEVGDQSGCPVLTFCWYLERFGHRTLYIHSCQQSAVQRGRHSKDSVFVAGTA